MLDKILPIICLVLFSYLFFILLRAYRPDWFRTRVLPGALPALGSAHGSAPLSHGSTTDVEHFTQHAAGPPVASPINTPSVPTPSPAPPGRTYEVTEPPRTVAPGGPGAPNAIDASARATISPEVMPIDPYQDSNMEAPIHDSLRHPELSFGPGMDNSGVKKAAASGVMNKATLSSESPFSPEFAQNGGQFMGDVTANDLSHDDTYATA